MGKPVSCNLGIWSPSQFRNQVQWRGLLYRDLAKRVNISYSALSKYAVGDRAPSYQTFLRICEVLHVYPKELLTPPGTLFL